MKTGELETIIGPDGPLTAPDDLVFDDEGAAYIVDLPPGLIWRRDVTGTMTIIARGIIAPDGIAWYRGRLFVNELCPQGRLLEIDLSGSGPDVLASDLMLGNAMQVGPDGFLYYPHLLGGEVWRVDLAGAPPELFLDNLHLPVAVRFDNAGRMLVLSNDVHGTLLTVDLETGHHSSTRTGVNGADNIAVSPDGILYISSAFHGGLLALHEDGTRDHVLPIGLCGPWGIDAQGEDSILVADHYSLVSLDRSNLLTPVGTPGEDTPVFIRGIASRTGAVHLTTDTGEIHSCDTRGQVTRRADNLSGPGDILAVEDGLIFTEIGSGRVCHLDDEDRIRVLADNLVTPVGLATDTTGEIYVSQREPGLVTRVRDGEVMMAGLTSPEGIAVLHGFLWCLEAGSGQLLRVCLQDGAADVVLRGLPLADPPNRVSKEYATQQASTRPRPFADLTRDGDSLLIGGSADGSILRLTMHVPS